MSPHGLEELVDKVAVIHMPERQMPEGINMPVEPEMPEEMSMQVEMESPITMMIIMPIILLEDADHLDLTLHRGIKDAIIHAN